MNKTFIFLLILIVLGNIYFRDAFHYIWLGLGIAFVLFLIVFHTLDAIKQKKIKKSREG